MGELFIAFVVLSVPVCCDYIPFAVSIEVEETAGFSRGLSCRVADARPPTKQVLHHSFGAGGSGEAWRFGALVLFLDDYLARGELNLLAPVYLKLKIASVSSIPGVVLHKGMVNVGVLHESVTEGLRYKRRHSGL